ncbi:MAG: DsbA family protein [Chloroflexi bacterium]|nr:DsbA family protein [Chloroflexota bacterium]
MKRELGDRLQIEWRYFSLEQVNQKHGPDWKVWDQPASYESRGNPSFMAAEAARRQGEDAFLRMHEELLKARHEEKRLFTDRETLMLAAQRAGLDLERFQRDLEDRSLLQKLARDHTEAVERYQAFGVPTFIFENGQAAYLKMYPPAPKEQAVAVFEELYQTTCLRPFIYELKRPGEHWPKK